MPQAAYWLVGLGIAIAGIGAGLVGQGLVLLFPQNAASIGDFLNKLGIVWIIMGLIPLITGTTFLIYHVMCRLMGKRI